MMRHYMPHAPNPRPPAAEPTVHDIEFRVRYGETDRMGVVYHPEYLAWCEMGRTEYIRSLGMSYAEMEQRGVPLVVAEASIRYHAPARYDDKIRVSTVLSRLGSRKVSHVPYCTARSGAGGFRSLFALGPRLGAAWPS